MKDAQGRGRIQRWKEDRFESGFHDEFNAELKQALDHPENLEILRKFISKRSMVKALIPHLIVGVMIAYVEFRLIGILYTILSLIVLFPLLYGYSISLRTRNGTFIMYPTDDALDWQRLFVAEPVWNLVNKKTGLTLEHSKINGRLAYWCTDVEFLSGTNIPYYVEIAWAHYNRAKYLMFAGVLDDLTAMLKDTLLEVAKLKKTSQVEAIVEGTRQTDERLKAIEMAFRNNVHEIVKGNSIDRSQADLMEENVNELLKNPTFMKALIEKNKRNDEGEK